MQSSINLVSGLKKENKKIHDRDKEDLLEEIIASEFDDFKFRVINPLEVENLTDEALDHLLYLKDSFSITEEAFEEVLVDISSIFGILDLESLQDLLNYRGIGIKQIVN